ncbi:MAG: hypothetical protein IT446_00045 [Phycisphaerales bacterium]|nr:hypothetical protein [Phycisphaerales bacterium]
MNPLLIDWLHGNPTSAMSEEDTVYCAQRPGELAIRDGVAQLLVPFQSYRRDGKVLVAGFAPENFQFKSGEKLQDITLNIPDCTPYVRKDERFVCFALCSQDDKPLADSSDIVAMAVSTSWNTGFKLDPDKFDAEMKITHGHGPKSAANAIVPGTKPVLVTRVGWTLDAPWLTGMTAERYDFSLKAYRTGKLDGPSLHVSAEEPLFFVELKRQ